MGMVGMLMGIEHGLDAIDFRIEQLFAPLVLPLLAVSLSACKPENKFMPPPPAEISVAPPLQQQVAPFEVLTGNTVSFATVDLVAPFDEDTPLELIRSARPVLLAT